MLVLLDTGEIFYNNRVDKDFQPVILDLRKQMSEVLKNWMTRNWSSESIGRFSNILFAGGGANEVCDYFYDLGPVITTAKDSQFANAHGFVSVGEHLK